MTAPSASSASSSPPSSRPRAEIALRARALPCGSHQNLVDSKPIYDELWASGAMPPMVLASASVSPLGFYLDHPGGRIRWESFIAQDFLLHLRRTYKVGGDLSSTIITGTSMGGHGSLRIAFRTPDRFASVRIVTARSSRPTIRLTWRSPTPTRSAPAASRFISKPATRIYSIFTTAPSFFIVCCGISIFRTSTIWCEARIMSGRLCCLECAMPTHGWVQF